MSARVLTALALALARVLNRSSSALASSPTCKRRMAAHGHCRSPTATTSIRDAWPRLGFIGKGGPACRLRRMTAGTPLGNRNASGKSAAARSTTAAPAARALAFARAAAASEVGELALSRGRVDQPAFEFD